jgi:LPS-assembly protein
MFKRLFLLISFIGSLSILIAEESASTPAPASAPNEIVLNANRFDYKNNIAYAYDDIYMRYKDNIFFANRATYDKDKNIITLEGNVQVVGSKGFKIIADRVIFEANDKHILFSDFYSINQDDIWIYATEAEGEKSSIKIKNSLLSSCSVKNSDWKVGFKEALYDSNTKYIKLKDVKFYAKDTPVFYTPYLGFSLNRERHSGFLIPVASYSPDDGFVYEQPYFWAISKSQDLEIRPQIRTERGYGLYNTFRFVNSPHSAGKIRFGYFRDYDDYQRRFSLENQNHYGFELLYEDSNLIGKFKPKGYEERLYINLNLFNDIDYLNLQNRGLFSHFEETNRYKESRINYFLYSDRDYFGLRTRYFIDTTVTDNSQTIQELPSLNYHKFISPLFCDRLYYSVDAKLTNLYREENPKAYRGYFSLPINFHTSFFGDYLNLSVEERFTTSSTHFSDGEIDSIDENYYLATILHHKIELSSDLIKSYSNGVHTVILSSSFTKSTKLAEGDLKFEQIDDGLIRDFDIETVYDSRITFGMHHFWESSDSEGLNIDYQIVADYYPEHDYEWNQLRQELSLKYGDFVLKSRFDYSLQYDHLTQFSNSFKYNGDRLKLSITHSRKEDEINRDLIENDLSFDGSYRYDDDLTLYGGYSYDFKDKMGKKWRAGFLYDRDCWNFSLIFEQDITPVLTSNDKGSIRNNSIIFKINFVPFGGIGTDSKSVGI